MILNFGLMHTDGFYGPMIPIKFFENHTLPKVLFRWKVLLLSYIYSARDYLTVIVVYILLTDYFFIMF